MEETNLEKIPPLPYPKVISYVNNFIINTVEFLNKFSGICEEKLSNVSQSIQHLEIRLSILEDKLSSIPIVGEFTPPPNITDELIPPNPEEKIEGEIEPPQNGNFLNKNQLKN
eukprot:Anaeramoba_ignava/c17214_g1_i2.p2 GENE.c17214_g1_i2~~c17214_g1_i2.p2  ORF type:complete len:113 (-),score=33.28 c17214_g1_i2:1490-1828(-)